MTPSHSTLAELNLEQLITLSLVPQFTVQSLRKLAQHIPLAQLFVKGEAARLGFNPEQCAQLTGSNQSQVDCTLNWLEQSNQHHYLSPFHAPLPGLLHELSRPPLLLLLKGDPSCLAQPQLAIVGSRVPTPVASKVTKQWASELVQAGFTVTSGLARGIDGFAHQGALAAKGKTIAVMGTGPDTVYPRRHHALAEQIVAQGGALLTEFLPNTAACAHHFPRRNRLIAGMSFGTCVMEAAVKSGSLITAKYAAEMGREVFAMPGSIQNPNTAGCHHLIQQGAKLVEKVADILEELSQFKKTQLYNYKQPSLFSQQQCGLLSLIGHDTTSIDQLVQQSGLTVEQVLSELLELELEQLIAAVDGGYVRL